MSTTDLAIFSGTLDDISSISELHNRRAVFATAANLPPAALQRGLAAFDEAIIHEAPRTLLAGGNIVDVLRGVLVVIGGLYSELEGNVKEEDGGEGPGSEFYGGTEVGEGVAVVPSVEDGMEGREIPETGDEGSDIEGGWEYRRRKRLRAGVMEDLVRDWVDEQSDDRAGDGGAMEKVRPRQSVVTQRFAYND